MASYYLTRRAARDLKEIYRYSSEKWGETVGQAYITDLYAAF